VFRFVTHLFAHAETRDRAERWLRQIGFQPTEIESSRSGLPWIAVACAGDRAAEAAMVFRAAETGDPDGWPSFWDVARMPHPAPAPPTDEPTATTTRDASARGFPMRWRPLDARPPQGDSALVQVWDVSERFS
jgi:hypothetical protein